MLAWLTENLATLLICAALAAVITLIIAVLIRDKQKGRSSCGGNCAHCPMGGCHSQKAASAVHSGTADANRQAHQKGGSHASDHAGN